MKKSIIFIIIATIIACVLIAGCATTAPKAPLQITYYSSPTCASCAVLDSDFIKLEQNHHGEFVLTKYDVNKEAVRFRNDLDKYHLDLMPGRFDAVKLIIEHMRQPGKRVPVCGIH